MKKLLRLNVRVVAVGMLQQPPLHFRVLTQTQKVRSLAFRAGIQVATLNEN